MKMEDGIVVAYEELSKEELLQLKSELEAQFDEVKAIFIISTGNLFY